MVKNMRGKVESRSRYFIAIIPPGPLYEEAQALKEYFRDRYASRAALNSPPHITLHMPFLWKEKNEQRMLAALEDFARRQNPMKICIDNFSGFPPRVIFMNVTTNDAMNALQSSLHAFMKRELDIFNANYQDRPFHPHLTLAFRDLRKEAYKQAWEEFAEREFKTEFVADRIALLKHDGNRWVVHREFLFGTPYSTAANPVLKTTEG